MKSICQFRVLPLLILAFTSLSHGGELSFTHEARPVLQKYCFDCHSSAKHKGDLDLERFTSTGEADAEPKIWQQVLEQLNLNEMPPKEKPQPSAAERKLLVEWIGATLERLALAQAGDPGPVVLRRLSNAEYSYTVRDLTGIPSLDPAREFPVDGAAGEGFMNTGNALVMSPSLISKYLDAGKAIANHAVLLPGGFRFSAATTRRDQTEEILTQIREFYRRYTDPRGGDKVNLQGIVFETNEGGRLPLEKYFAATFALRDRTSTVEKLAAERGLSPKYLRTLYTSLTNSEPSLLLDQIRVRWRVSSAADSAALAEEAGRFQKTLWKFSSVGHIGKAGGPKAWMEPISPIAERQEFRVKLSPATNESHVVLYFVAGDAGDGHENDVAQWQEPRLEAPGRAPLLLKDVPAAETSLREARREFIGSLENALSAAAELRKSTSARILDQLAADHGVSASALEAWLDVLGFQSEGGPKIEGHFTKQMTNVSGYSFVNGWGAAETPLLVANASDQHVRIPGNLKPRSVAVHPSPTLQAAVAWQSPIEGKVRVEASVTHAHPECGNGVTWSLQLRRGSNRQRLASGTAQGANEKRIGPFDKISLRQGDIVSLLIGPRDGNHSCDLTAVDLAISDGTHEWSLAHEVSGDILAANPHSDRFGNSSVWHFYTEANNRPDGSFSLPPNSLLSRWTESDTTEERATLAHDLAALLKGSATATSEPDRLLRHQLLSLSGPLLRREWTRLAGAAWPSTSAAEANSPFGKHPAGSALSPASLAVRAPSVTFVSVPADLAEGAELVTTGLPEPEASVQLQITVVKPEPNSGLIASPVSVKDANGQWTGNNRRVSHETPILAAAESGVRKRLEKDFEHFRALFPAALCYTKIVPVDEVVTLTLYYREDHQLARLMLDEAQAADLDRLWAELHFVSQDALTLVDAFEQLWQYATQDADPKVFEPLRKPIQDRAADFRKLLAESEPRQVQAVIDFAGRAYRRPLTETEKDELTSLYQQLRSEELPHDQALKLLLARVFVAPAFLYKLERPAPGTDSAPVSPWELATRLSYFLWSSLPDAELKSSAASGNLAQPEELVRQTRRMLQDGRIRRLATEFGCQWIHVRDFDTLDEKSERHFPSFAHLRGGMYEETILFFTELFRRNASVLEILNADYSYLNEDLAKHYGIPGVSGPEWRRIDGLRQFGRGGILAQASTLAKQSGASRTSPILRGNWVAEVILGDKLPRPPKDVPRLPEEEGANGLTVRQLTEKHSTDPRCAGCHVRIDPFGYALERFDAIGRTRDQDLAGGAIDTRARALDGTQIDGLEGLRDYLVTKRRDAFVHQFCRKLLGYALGRAVQLSDTPLIREMERQLEAHDFQISVAIETIVCSRQFREIRGRDAVFAQN